MALGRPSGHDPASGVAGPDGRQRCRRSASARRPSRPTRSSTGRASTWSRTPRPRTRSVWRSLRRRLGQALVITPVGPRPPIGWRAGLRRAGASVARWPSDWAAAAGGCHGRRRPRRGVRPGAGPRCGRGVRRARRGAPERVVPDVARPGGRGRAGPSCRRSRACSCHRVPSLEALALARPVRPNRAAERAGLGAS